MGDFHRTPKKPTVEILEKNIAFLFIDKNPELLHLVLR